MPNQTSDERGVFLEALKLPSAEERAAFVQGACGSDEKLFSRVQELLRAHDESRGPLDTPPSAVDSSSTIDHSIAESVGDHIGPYKLLQEVGHGGMGVVYMAEQKEPVKRRVALKIIKPGMDTQQVIVRFEAERQALAMMDHPNIAKVLDAGATESGRPYFVMELVNGVPVTEYCDEQHLTPRERLKLFVPICQAVQHAHQKGIIHRDLKPSNVLVALYDGQPVPKVIDFGVAKATTQTLTEKTLFTQLGQVVGTLEYMSPEQAQRNQLDIDTRSDVYSLGVLLYELLTGTTPFDRKRLRSAAFDEMLRIIREEEPPRPSTKLSTIGTLPSVAANRRTEPQKLTTIIRGELDWIVMKALEKDRGRRYETATGFAADIERFLSSEAVQACPPSAAYRVRKFVQRYRGAVGAAAALLAVLCLGLVGTSLGLLNAARARDRERAALRTTQENLYYSQMSEAGRASQERDGIGRIEDLLASWVPQWADHDYRAWEWYYLSSLCNQHLLALPGHKADITAVAWSTDGKLASASSDHTVRIWDTALGRALHVLEGHTAPVTSVSWSPNGAQLATASEDRTTRIWDTTTGAEINRVAGHKYPIISIDWSSKGLLATAGGLPTHTVTGGREFDVVINIWNTDKKTPIRSIQGHTSPIRSICWSPDGEYLASTSGGWFFDEDNSVRIWDVDGREQRRFDHQQRVNSVEWSSDAQHLAWVSGLNWGTVHVWKVGTDEPLTKFPSSGARVLQWRPDGQRLALAGDDRRILVLNSQTGTAEYEVRMSQAVYTLDWNNDGTLLASGSVEGAVKVWGAEPKEEPLSLAAPKGMNLWDFDWSPDGRQLVSTSPRDSSFSIWDAATGELQQRIEHPAPLATSWSHDGRWLAIGSGDGTLSVCNALTGQPSFTLVGHKRQVWRTRWSPDDRRLASSGSDYTVRVWDIASKRQLLELEHTSAVVGLCWSPDGESVAAGDWGGQVRIWDATTNGVPISTLKHSGWVKGLSWSPDGKWIAGAGQDDKVRVWRAATGDEFRVLRHTGHVNDVTWSPDCKRLLSLGGGGRAIIWDVNSGQESLSVTTDIEQAEVGKWSPDGRRLAIGGGTFTRDSNEPLIQIWDATRGYELEQQRKKRHVNSMGGS